MIARFSVAVAVALLSSSAWAQPATRDEQAIARDPRLAQALPSAQAADVIYANRIITRLRARVLTNMPVDRARAASDTLDDLVDNARLVDKNAVGPVTIAEASGVVILRVGDRNVLTLVQADVDELTGETLSQKAVEAAAALRIALAEAIELRTPERLFRAGLWVLAATMLFGAALFLLRLGHLRLHRVLIGATGQAFGRVLPSDTAREPAALVSRFIGVGVTLAIFGFAGLLSYWWLTFSLRQFPYTRPWGESLRTRLLQLLGEVGQSVVAALPGLFIVLIVVATTRLLVRVSNGFFTSVERGRVETTWAHPDTAGATRRLVAVVLWLFALIVSYPYLPGSGSDAFKGVSVFVGLVLSLGSSGVVNQMMSGLTLIYSRAIRIGDVARLGDNVGVVSAMSLLSVKLRTAMGEEITVPNSVVVGNSTTNYTKVAPSGGSYLSTSITIGYDTPWRQVRALLILAAERCQNVRDDPPPTVVQASLEDFYVRYDLLVCLEDSMDWVGTRDRLHASILDAFNEYGVQITSPNYEADPETPKVVPLDRWFESPAARPGTKATPPIRGQAD
jgi:small-conductance mechanosensitive channel